MVRVSPSDSARVEQIRAEEDGGELTLYIASNADAWITSNAYLPVSKVC
jgi:hypothetical protein